MTKKDYIRIGDILKRHLQGAAKCDQKSLVALTLDIAAMLKTDNPNFNRDRFIDHICNNS